MKKVKITKRNVVLSLTRKEFAVLFELVEERSYECICDLDSSRGIPIPEGSKRYLQKCELICMMASWLRLINADIYLADMPCPFGDSDEG